MAAGAIVLIVAGVYAQRAVREARTRRSQPASVPATVQQQSEETSFSKVEGDRTIFTVRSSHATQFKDQNKYLLEDVWITIYGREGNRNDNIHARECGYEPGSGDVRCEGDVQIDVSGANPASGNPGEQVIHITTRNLTFNRESGEASTPEPVAFRFPQGTGHAVGITYNTQKAFVLLQSAVELDMAPSERTSSLPVTATGSSLEIRRDEHLVVLSGPAVVHQANRELAAEKITIELDAEFHAQHAIANGHPVVHSTESGGPVTLSADQLEASLDPAGWIQRILAEGNVQGTRKTAAGTDNFSGAHVELAMGPRNQIEKMTASGGLKLDSGQGSDLKTLTTESLRAVFGPGKQPDHRRVESAETLAPGTIELKTGGDATEIRAKKFVAQFGDDGHIQKLLGHSGAEFRRQIGGGAPQTGTAAELAATFGANGQWDIVDESGNVRFQQTDRQASAARAHIVRATDTITLDGSPVLFDSVSRTTAANFSINQKSGDIRGTGGVASTYQPAAQGSAVNLGAGPAHVSADRFTGSNASGHVVYTGHARLWQGDSVLDADEIEIWRDEKKMKAVGNVVAIFPEASSQFAKLPSGPSKPSPAKPSAPPSNTPSGPTLWDIHAPTLTYWSDTGKAHLEGGVSANSQQGSLVSRTLDVFLAPGPPTPGSLATSAAPASASQTPNAGRQLERALALGGVVVRQGDRRGTSDQAEYTAADGKFVLSGGNPTLTDAASDTTTGHSLTFFVANDTILIDSQEGLRTLTKHRVEK
jgi:LPS export ABC transporter protein LptC